MNRENNGTSELKSDFNFLNIQERLRHLVLSIEVQKESWARMVQCWGPFFSLDGQMLLEQTAMKVAVEGADV